MGFNIKPLGSHSSFFAKDHQYAWTVEQKLDGAHCLCGSRTNRKLHKSTGPSILASRRDC